MKFPIQKITPVVVVTCLAGCSKFEEVSVNYYDGVDDGLIAALGLSGLRGDAPGYVDANNPTTSEIRRNTIYNNYRALIDVTDAGGYGRLYGPTDDTTYSGYEYIAYVGEGINRASVMVQIPDNFNREQPCIVAAPSSGSRGIYGAIGTSGAWGLENNCVVTYTDANKGTGAVALTENLGFDAEGNLIELETQAKASSFVVPTSENAVGDKELKRATLPTQAELDTYIANNPNRLAFKHAHSQKNIEKDWGKHTLQAIEYAFDVLNRHFEDQTFKPNNTWVLAASISNGGAAVLRAAEMDALGLIDAVVAGEPQINPQLASGDVRISVPGRADVFNGGKPLVQYVIESELFAACAGAAPSMAGKAFMELRGDVTARCEALAEAGFIESGSKADMGQQALDALLANGYTEESLVIAAGYGGLDLFQSLSATYAMSISRASAVDALCNVSFAAVGADFKPAPSPTLATLATSSSGIPRTANIVPIKDDALGGPTSQVAALSSNGQADYNFEAALCWYDLLTNENNARYASLQTGISELQGTGYLRGKPTLIVHGRDDAVVPVNHSSRYYAVLNQQREGEQSNLSYIEVTNAQHLDSLNGLYQLFGMNYVPIDYYFKVALDQMKAHAFDGEALPPSQTVRTRAPSAGELLQLEHVPMPVMEPGPLGIDVTATSIVIPE